MQEIKVLIIAEEPEFSDNLTDRLRSWGFTAIAADSCENPLEAITLSPPDVVVLSLRAGHGHNLDTLSMIKDLDPAIEVILLTGKGTALTGMQSVERGAFDCLPQPIELGVLIEKIRKAHARRFLPPQKNFVALLLPLLSTEDSADLCTAFLTRLHSLSEYLLPL